MALKAATIVELQTKEEETAEQLKEQSEELERLREQLEEKEGADEVEASAADDDEVDAKSEVAAQQAELDLMRADLLAAQEKLQTSESDHLLQVSNKQ